MSVQDLDSVGYFWLIEKYLLMVTLWTLECSSVFIRKMWRTLQAIFVVYLVKTVLFRFHITKSHPSSREWASDVLWICFWFTLAWLSAPNPWWVGPLPKYSLYSVLGPLMLVYKEHGQKEYALPCIPDLHSLDHGMNAQSTVFPQRGAACPPHTFQTIGRGHMIDIAKTLITKLEQAYF